MKLPRTGQEYAHFPTSGAPDDAAVLEVSFDGGVTWDPMTWAADKSSAYVLVAGPNFVDPRGIVLQVGKNTPVVRMTDTPEVVIRTTGGSIDVA